MAPVPPAVGEVDLEPPAGVLAMHKHELTFGVAAQHQMLRARWRYRRRGKVEEEALRPVAGAVEEDDILAGVPSVVWDLQESPRLQLLEGRRIWPLFANQHHRGVRASLRHRAVHPTGIVQLLGRPRDQASLVVGPRHHAQQVELVHPKSDDDRDLASVDEACLVGPLVVSEKACLVDQAATLAIESCSRRGGQRLHRLVH
mmetsp:Transcript_11951/g.33734  ORF Transcript_11951/g.33734 Transcript_11951/m.33734 type:complete len:201 (+) Transcript_11951:2281-2883(+)